METLSKELEELLDNSFALRRTLIQVLPKEAVDYLLTLAAKDVAHRKFLNITEEQENGSSV